MLKKTMCTIILMVIVVNIICTMIYLNEDRKIDKSYSEYELELPSRPGMIGATVTFDKTVTDPILIRPDGFEFNKENAYFYEQKGNTVTICADSNITDKPWKLLVQNADNEHIAYKLVNRPSKSLYVVDVSLQQIGKEYCLFATPIYGEPTDTRAICQYTITITDNVEHTSVALQAGYLRINSENIYPITFPAELFDRQRQTIEEKLQSLQEETQATAQTDIQTDTQTDNPDLPSESENTVSVNALDLAHSKTLAIQFAICDDSDREASAKAGTVNWSTEIILEPIDMTANDQTEK